MFLTSTHVNDKFLLLAKERIKAMTPATQGAADEAPSKDSITGCTGYTPVVMTPTVVAPPATKSKPPMPDTRIADPGAPYLLCELSVTFLGATTIEA